MNDQSTSPVAGWRLAFFALAFALLGGVIGWFWQGRHMEQVVHDYVLANPEILPQAMENLRKREDAKQLAGISADLKKPFPGAVLGNPQGKVTLVEFSDFACTFCRQSEAEVAALIQANPDLKVVIRQLPILSQASADAARMGLAAAKQGRYAAYHHAMYAAGRPDAATIEAAARSAGLDMARAQKDATDPAIAAEIDANVEFARKLGFEGTPSWVVGEEIHGGAVGLEVLAAAIKKARG